MDRYKLIQKLEGIIEKRTLSYTGLSEPRGDEKLFGAHYGLAILYGKIGADKQARHHYEEAEQELYDLSESEKANLPDYISNVEDIKKIEAQERELNKKLRHYAKKLIEVANEFGFEIAPIVFCIGSNKRNLNELLTE